jgi:hypothetical protein
VTPRPETLLSSQALLSAWFPGCVVRLRRHNRLELVGDLGGRREPAEDLCRNDLLIRRTGQVVQDRPSVVVGWADIPELSLSGRVAFKMRRPAAATP